MWKIILPLKRLHAFVRHSLSKTNHNPKERKPRKYYDVLIITLRFLEHLLQSLDINHFLVLKYHNK
jgi:hypothetical protein